MGYENREHTIIKIDNKELAAQLAEKATKAEAEEIEKKAVSTVSHKIDKKTIVSFFDDDGNSKVMSILKPIFDAEGVPCTVAVITSQIDNNPGHITSNDMKALKNAGWTVCSHTHTHIYLGDNNESTNEYEIKTSKQILDNLGMDGDILVYPFGSASDITRKVTRKHMVLGIGGYNTYNPMPINTYNLARFTNISANNFDLAGCKSIIDNAPANSWIIFYTHVNYDTFLQQTTIDQFHELIQYIKNKGIEIVNMKEGLERKGNIVDAGDSTKFFKVGKDASILSNPFYDAAITNDSPITSFPLGETELAFSSTEMTSKGFPSSAASRINTFRVPYTTYSQPDLFSYQTLQSYLTNDIQKRRWDVTANGWTPWELIAKVQTSWLGTVDIISGAFRAVGTTKVTNYVYFEKFFSLGATQPTLTKEVWKIDEISIDSAVPTDIGTIGTGKVQIYRDAKNIIYVKYSVSGYNALAFIKTAFY